MKEIKVDVAVLGAGTAGLGARRAALKHKKRVVLIEGGPHGTTCARVGCMPSKLLIASAEAAHAVREASSLGVHTGPFQINGVEIMERVRRERDRFVGFVLESVEAIEADQKLHGYARFLDPHRLQVDDHTLVHAETVVIATGSTPAVPPPFHELGDRLIINDDVFEWRDLPRGVAVFGPGVIGLELGQALHRLGVRTFIFGRSGNIGPITDPKIQEYCQRIFGREFYLDSNAEITEMKRADDRVHIAFKDRKGRSRQESFDYVLAAIGRKPNLANLGLEHSGLELDARGIPRFDPFTMQAGDSHIFIAGDVNHFRPILHEAADEGRIAGENAGRFPDIRSGLRRSSMGVVFTDPQMATVGCSFADLNRTPDCFAIGEVSFENQGRSRVMLKNKGLLRVYAQHGTGLLLGAEIFGPRAEHLAHLLAWSHQQKMTVKQMLEMPFYHPVIEEGLRTALRDANNKLHLGPLPVPGCLDCGPGA